jgi:hypothetical protein
MHPKSLEALKFIAESTKPVTTKQFIKKYDELVLATILPTQVEEVSGVLVVNTAGKSVIDMYDTLKK